jgi:hypothetical protein
LWSGTSFSTAHVSAALAAEIAKGTPASGALAAVVGDSNSGVRETVAAATDPTGCKKP